METKYIAVYVDGKGMFKLIVTRKKSIGDILKEASDGLKRQGVSTENYDLAFRASDKGDIAPSDIEKYRNKSPYDNIVVGQAALIYNKKSQVGFSGIKDVDILVLENLNDKDLFAYCLVDKYAQKLCKDENFWRRRFIQKYGETAAKYKPTNRTWKKHYAKVVYVLSQYDDPWTFFDKIIWRVNEDEMKVGVFDERFAIIPIDKTDEDTMIAYWLLNLGNKIKIAYELDREAHMDSVIKEYTTQTYFSPADVLKLVNEFYEQPITEENFRQQVETDNPYAEDYTIEQVRRGEVKRKYLIGIRFFEGFTLYDGIRYLDMGT